MTLHSQNEFFIPEETVRIARAAVWYTSTSLMNACDFYPFLSGASLDKEYRILRVRFPM